MAFFPNRIASQPFLAVSETIGHLDLLELDGVIARETTREGVVWRAIPGRDLQA